MPHFKRFFHVWVRIYILCGCLFILAACDSASPAQVPASGTSAPVKPPQTQPSGIPPRNGIALSITPTVPAIVSADPASQGAKDLPLQLCSPLQGFGRDMLLQNIVNPYNPPLPGSDDPHQGVDIAEMLPGRIAIPGREVRAALPGLVAGSLPERFPYGMAVMVETPLADIPPEWLTALQLPDMLSDWTPDPALTCPPYEFSPSADGGLSLYVLYAHLGGQAALQPGGAVEGGQPLGLVGESGNALNPHLHFEVRLGPSGARFNSMAHYDPSVTPEEMAAYCAWRIGGAFRLVDPLKLLSLPMAVQLE